MGRETSGQDPTPTTKAQRRTGRGIQVNTYTAPANTMPDTGAPTAFYDLAAGTVRFRPRDASAPNVSEILDALRKDDGDGAAEVVP